METNTSVARTGGTIRRILDLLNRLAHMNWALADQAVVSGTNFATTILIARFLGVEEFGRFALAWLAIYFSQNLQIALVIDPMMTIGAKQPVAKRAAYSGAVIAQQAGLALISFVLVLALLGVSDSVFPQWELSQYALPVALLVLAGQGADFLRRYYFTFSRPGLSFTIDCVRYGGQLVLLGALFVLAGSQATIGGAFYTMAIASFAAFLFGAVFMGAITLTGDIFSEVIRRHWRFARWLAPSVLSLWGRENLLFISVGAFVGLAEVGILRAAQQLVMMANVPLHGFANVVPMRAAEALERNGYRGLVDFIDRFVLRYMTAILVLVAAIALNGNFILAFVYGAEYANAGTVVAAFAMVMSVHLLRNIVGITVHALERTEYEFYASAASIVVLAAVIFPLVQWYGVAGALIGALLYETAALFAVSFGLQRVGGRAWS